MTVGRDFAEIRDLFKAIDDGQWDDVNLRLGETRISVRRHRMPCSVPGAEAPAIVGSVEERAVAAIPAKGAKDEGVHRITASMVGRIAWAGEPGQLIGKRVVPDTLLARIEVDGRSVDVVAGKTGAMGHVSAVHDGELVQYGELLAIVRCDPKSG